MRRHFRGFLVMLFAALSLMLGGLWIASYRGVVHFAGTTETSLLQIIAVRGHLYFWTTEHWWRAEEWRVVGDSSVSSDPIEEWPGMFVESHRSWLGFESASGKWKTPGVKVTKADRALNKMQIPVGSIFSALLPFHLVGIPLWVAWLASLIAFGLLLWIWRRFRARQAPQLGK